MPEIAFGNDFLPGGDSKAYRYMHLMSMPASNCRCRFSSHGCMNSILGETTEGLFEVVDVISTNRVFVGSELKEV